MKKSFIASGKKKIREYKEFELSICDYESFPEEFMTGNRNIYLRVIPENNTFRQTPWRVNTKSDTFRGIIKSSSIFTIKFQMFFFKISVLLEGI